MPDSRARHLLTAMLVGAAWLTGCDSTSSVVGGGGDGGNDLGATLDLGVDVGPADVPPVDRPPVCAATEILCGNRCVPAATDNANCGACGNACAAGQVCAMGRCSVSCGITLATCGGIPDAGDAGGAPYCADLATDRANCGACGQACPEGNICVGRSCQVSCVVGQTLCGASCRDLQTDLANCGTCGNACASGQVCSGGTCAASCGTGLTNCGGACVSTVTDPTHCGACDGECRLPNVGVQACVASACVVGSCASGYADCDGTPANGCETNVRAADVANCGGCGIRCAYANAAPVCAAGVCSRGECAAGFADCDGNPDNGCEVNILADNGNCGACSTSAAPRACASGQVCSAGSCAASCGAGLTNCGGSCVNTITDTTHCGNCATSCSLTNVSVQACAASTCVVGGCASGFGDCDGAPANGCETAVRGTDVNNCGGCGIRCAFANAATTCVAGACAMGTCATGFADCDGNPANGCEVNLTTDGANCGACSTTAAPHACASGQVCSAGVCAASCGAGLTDCSGDCVRTPSDPRNCGGCGMVCNLSGASVQACSGSACVIGGCLAGLADCNRTAADGCETNIAADDVNNCGGCGLRCSFPNAAATCATGTCRLGTCNTGFADCDGNPANGCEVDIRSNNGNCGACSTMTTLRACPSGQICSSGVCAASCGAGLTACGGACVSTSTDPSHCGDCGAVCNLPSVTVHACVAGACAVTTCAVGRADCDRNPLNGCEAVINGTDANNCGGCGVACNFANAGSTCAAGTCQLGACATGFGNCDGNASNGCETNLTTSLTHCGACSTPALSRACAAGTVCSSGTCQASCGTGLTNCSGACRNLTSDPANCNGCGALCPSGANSTAFCTGSSCGLRCASGFADCNAIASDGCERSTTTLSDCGACGRACVFPNAGAACSTAGVCSMGACNTGFADCNANPADGCEVNLLTDRTHCGACTGASTSCASGQVCASGVCAASCGLGLTNCSGGCTNLQFDPSNCNACGMICPARTNARAACSGGGCGIICNTGFGNCDGVDTNGCEVDLTTSNSHCGGCGVVCGAGLSCVAGACALYPRYTFSVPAPAPTFIDACAAAGHLTFLDNVDDSIVSQTLPFDFPYWGTLLTSGSTIFLSSNANIQLAGPGSNAYSGTVIPQVDSANGTVAVHWGDTYTRTPGLCAVTVGATPSRQYVVEWTNAYYYLNAAPSLTFEVVLRETTGVIDMIYQTMNGVRLQTTGLENLTSTTAIRPTDGSCNAATSDNCLPVAGTVYRFTPSL